MVWSAPRGPGETGRGPAGPATAGPPRIGAVRSGGPRGAGRDRAGGVRPGHRATGPPGPRPPGAALAGPAGPPGPSSSESSFLRTKISTIAHDAEQHQHAADGDEDPGQARLRLVRGGVVLSRRWCRSRSALVDGGAAGAGASRVGELAGLTVRRTLCQRLAGDAGLGGLVTAGCRPSRPGSRSSPAGIGFSVVESILNAPCRRCRCRPSVRRVGRVLMLTFAPLIGGWCRRR